MAKPRFPISSLDICLSNRCNLACRYCYFDALNQGPALSLDVAHIRRALKHYVGLVGREGIDKISLAGGEPLLDPALLESIVRTLRAGCGRRTEIELFTNGTLLTPVHARRLMALGAKLVVSIDGTRESNDRNRRFRGQPGRSVFDAVSANLAGLRKDELRRVCASMTVNPNTARSLRGNVRFLRELGFGEVQVNLNILVPWSRKALSDLRRGVAELRIYLGGLAERELTSFETFRFGLEYVLLKWDEDVRASAVFKEISLGPDGAFYPCGLVSTFGTEKSGCRIGDLRKGLAAARMRSMRKDAVDRILEYDKGCGLLKVLPNPMMLYFAIRLKKLDPKVMFPSARDAFRAFYDGMGELLRIERFLDVLSSDARFGDFEHEPRTRTDKPMRSLRIRLEGAGSVAGACACSKGLVAFPGLAELRESIDLLLYAPGRDKRLVFNMDSVDRDFELAGALSFYTLLKAARLGKDVEILLVCPPQRVEEENLDFIRTHGLRLLYELSDPKDAAEAPGALVVLCSGSARVLDRLIRRGVRDIRLEDPRSADPACPFLDGLCSDRDGLWTFHRAGLSAASRRGPGLPAGGCADGLLERFRSCRYDAGSAACRACSARAGGALRMPAAAWRPSRLFQNTA
ncbi:MAG: radical SAM protein [Elusimicrobiota bacterium]